MAEMQIRGSQVKDGVVKPDGTIPFTSDQSLGGHKLTNVADPTSAQDAATKAYVDGGGGGGGGGATISSAVFASRPSAGTAGNLFLPTDAAVTERDNGTTWDPWGPVFAFTPPIDGNYSWLNQGSSSVDASRDTITLIGAAAGNVQNFVGREKATPSTPWTVTAFIKATAFNKNNNQWGLYLRQAGTGTGQNRIRAMFYGQFAASATAPGNAFFIAGRTAFGNDWSDFPQTWPYGVFFNWLRISDDGTNVTFSVSQDGRNWVQYRQESRTTYLLQGPDRIGFFVNTQNTATPNLGVNLALFSWKET